MAERAVFLDRDNTIIDNSGYLGDPSKVKLLPGAATALSAIRALGYRLIVVSNQSGVARGLFDEAAVESVNDEMSRQLRALSGAYIDASYYCPYHPEAVVAEYRLDHDWRKPKPGMLKQAAADFNLDLAQSWMIGDQARDIAAGVAAGCRTILLRDSDRNPVPASADADPEGLNVSPNFVVRTLADAARIIVREGRQPQSPAATPAAPPAPISAPLPSPAAAVPPARAPIQSAARPMPGAPAAATADAESDPLPPPPALQVEAPAPSSRFQHDLDELIIQLRQQNRQAHLRPDFSFSNMASLVLQAFAIVALVIGLANHFTAKATYAKPEDFYLALLSYESATMWITAAVMLQGMVISLLIYSRQK